MDQLTIKKLESAQQSISGPDMIKIFGGSLSNQYSTGYHMMKKWKEADLNVLTFLSLLDDEKREIFLTYIYNKY